MKKIPLLLLLFIAAPPAFSQFFAKLALSEPVEGLCDWTNVYSIIPGFDDQTEAKGPDEDQIFRAIENLDFLKKNPKYKGKGMVHLLINCEGELVQCQMSREFSDPEFNRQLLELFGTYKKWIAGTVGHRAVDVSILYGFRVVRGKVEDWP